MSELTDDIVNKGLAEFMGFYILTDELEECTECDNKWYIASYIDEKISPYKTTSPVYTESLDSLIPIWEKLRGVESGYKNICIEMDYLNFDEDGNFWKFNINCGKRPSGSYEKLSTAAAYATYKACVELGLIKE